MENHTFIRSFTLQKLRLPSQFNGLPPVNEVNTTNCLPPSLQTSILVLKIDMLIEKSFVAFQPAAAAPNYDNRRV